MSKFFRVTGVAFATVLAATATFAGDRRPGTNNPSGAANVTAGAVSSAAARAEVNNIVATAVDVAVKNALAQQQSQQQQMQQSQGQTSNSQANVSGSGNNGSNSNNIVVEKSAPGMSVGQQNAPVYNCRWSIGIAASSPGGGGALSGIPLWKEGDCQGVQAVMVMSYAGTNFTAEDVTRVACTIERVAESKTCEKIRQQDADRKQAMALYGN